MFVNAIVAFALLAGFSAAQNTTVNIGALNETLKGKFTNEVGGVEI